MLAFFQELADRYPKVEVVDIPVVTTCKICGHITPNGWTVCEQCTEDERRGYRTLVLAGRCANGSELDSGTRWHAVEKGKYVAMCGAKPGRRSAGWSSWQIPYQYPTCPRCAPKVRRLEQMIAEDGPTSEDMGF